VAQLFAEFAVLGLIWLWVRGELIWPSDHAQRAIIGLVAFGVFASRCGGSLMTRIGTNENGFA
jgi:hypothetical protein